MQTSGLINSSWPAASYKSFKKKVIENQTEKYFSAGGEKLEKSKSTVALYTAQAKVLQHYTAAAQGIVVYLKWPRRRRENANVLRRHRATTQKSRRLA